MSTSSVTKSSRSFGKALAKSFRTINGKPSAGPNEVKKFTDLISSFNGLSGFHTESYHGHKSQVRFPGHAIFTRASPQCELCDVLFVTYAGKEVRVSFLQAKATSSNNAFPIYFPNSEQYYLLASRQHISQWVGSVVWPNDILSSAILASVASIGVFYNHPSGKFVDFHYVIADQLGCCYPPKLTGKYPAVALVQRKHRGSRMIQTKGPYSERSYCTNLESFAEALHSMQIGTPIDAGSDGFSATTGKNKDATRRARTALASWIASQAKPSDLLRELQDVLDVGQIRPDGDSIGTRHVVVVKGSNDQGNVNDVTDNRNE